MSRSYRKPYGTWSSVKESARPDKQLANRGVRRRQEAWLRGLPALALGFDSELVPHRYECAHNDIWGWNLDGPKRLMRPSSREWYEYRRVGNDGPWSSERDARVTRKYHRVWPPAWYVALQRK